jgi:hypothetical protein
MFFSFVGLILAVIWAGALLVERWMTAEQRVRLRPAAVVLALLALSGYAYGVHRRNEVWRSEETLWLDDVQKSPHNGRGLMNYALHCRRDCATEHLSRSHASRAQLARASAARPGRHVQCRPACAGRRRRL